MKSEALKALMIDLMKTLDVNTNIRNFGERWLNEQAELSLDGCLSFLDRLDIPYEIHSVTKLLKSQEYLLGVFITGATGSLFQNHDGQLVSVTPNETPEPISKESLKTMPIAILITAPPREKPDADWLAIRLKRYRPILPKLLFLSFVANLFALSIPFITMAVYDHVIGGGAAHELPGIAIGALLLFAMMLSMRVLRSQLLTTIANRVSRDISEAVLNRLFRTQASVLKQTPFSSLGARIAVGDRLKALTQGPLGGALLDLPFVIMFLIAIGVLGGWLVIVPIVSILLYLTLALRSQKQAAQMSNPTTVSGASRQSLIEEVAAKLYFMKGSNVIPQWLNRFEQANALASRNTFIMATHQAKYTSAYYFLSIGSNLAVIALGIGLIFEGLMSPGGLIATMMLISRVTGPVNMLASSAAKFPQARQAKVQVNQYVSQKVEGSYTFQHVPLPHEAPSIELDQLTIRFPNQMRPALSGISAKIESGELVAVTGAMGSGKTSLMEAIGGLLTAQNGFIKVNGTNLTQFDPQLYRHWLGYRGEQPQMLLTTIREFLLDGRELTDEQLELALAAAGGSDWFNSLPEGLSTHLDEIIPSCLTDRMIDYEGRILAHAKLIAHPFPLYLLDMPTLNRAEREGFIEFISERRGSSTVIFVTHDTELIKLSDQVIVLDKGAVSYAGPVPQDDDSEVNTEPLTTEDEGNSSPSNGTTHE